MREDEAGMSDPKQRKIAGVDPAMPANQSRAVTGTIPGDWMDLKSAAEGPPIRGAELIRAPRGSSERA